MFPNSAPRPPTHPPSPLPQPTPTHLETERSASPPRQPTPTHPETEPSASPRYRFPPRQPTPKRKRAAKKKPEPSAKKKLAYEMTVEENKAEVAAQVQAHFGPKPPPPPKEIIPKKITNHFVNLLERPSAHEEKRQQSDYDRSIRK